MDLTKAARAALNALVDIASHSMNSQPVPVPDLAKRQKLSISRIEMILRPLRESGFVRGTKGRRGGYVLSQDPRLITIKDYVPSFSEVKKAPERTAYVPLNPKKEQRKKGEVQKVVKAQIKKAEEMPRWPNSVFDFDNFLDRKSS